MIETALSRHAKAVTQRMNGGRFDVPTLAEVRELLENVSIALAAEVGEYPKVAASVHAIALCLQLPPSRTRIATITTPSVAARKGRRRGIVACIEVQVYTLRVRL
jgi:hypothetical protein